MHLASGFQLAGFPHVVATLWPINDRIAVDIAVDFYDHLTGPGGQLRLQDAALALHQAVRAQRDRLPATPSLWAAHIHTGA